MMVSAVDTFLGGFILKDLLLHHWLHAVLAQLIVSESPTLGLSLTEFLRGFFSDDLSIFLIILGFFWLPLASGNKRILPSTSLRLTETACSVT